MEGDKVNKYFKDLKNDKNANFFSKFPQILV